MGEAMGDTFFVRMLAGDFGACARANADRFQWISFARDFKGSHQTRRLPLSKLARHGINKHATTAAE